MSIQVNWTPIIIGLVAFAVGYLFAMLDRRVTKAIRKKGDDEVRVVEKIVEKPVPMPDASALSIILDAGVPPRVRLDGMEVGEGLTAEQRKRMIGLLTIIRPLLEGKPVPATPVSVPPAAAPAAAPHPIAPAQAAPVPVLAAQPRKSQPAPTLDEDELPVKNSMVAQIDVILQEQIHGTPLENKGIHLMDAPGGGVLVYVGLTRYEGVGEVTDPEIQAALRKAIAAWEDKYTPGL